MDPLITFGLDKFAYLKNIGVQIKEKKITVKTAIGFGLFWQNTEPKKPFCEPSPLSNCQKGEKCFYREQIKLPGNNVMLSF